MIFELYNAQTGEEKHYSKEFKDFYPWGKMILSDFNEIDKYLIDTDVLFRTLKEFKTVEDITKDEKSEIYNRYTGFWESLGVLYREFNSLLQRKSKAYEGMIYRRVASDLLGGEAIPRLKWKKVVFCGFNALSKSEEVIIGHLLEEEKAEIYWDMDGYFVNDRNQEAGEFFRKNMNLKGMRDPLWVEDRLSEPKEITIIGVQSKVSQAKVLGLKLGELLESVENPEGVAVVLPDETMLFPTLNSLPEAVEKVNITIGFPLYQTPAYSLFNAVIEMQVQLLESKGRTEGFYYKDVQRVLSHPYIKPVAPGEIAAFIAANKERGEVYLTKRDLRNLPEPLTDFFSLRENSHQLIRFFLDQLIFIRSFYDENKQELFNIDYEYMYHFYTLLTKLKDSLDASGLVLPLRTFRQLFADIVQSSRIPFTGEPLEGLQLMGLLETQTLDFENLFILSVNEDYLPPGKGQQSFIPYEVRSHMKMPTHRERDAMTAYHFYRLLKRAKHATLIYTTGAKRIEKSEKSRFIDQLLIEFAERNKKVTVRHHIMDFEFDRQGVKAISIKKSPEIIEILAKKSYSASSLLNYLRCSLKFYFNYVLKLYEEEDVYESPDFRLIGDIIHDTLHKLYKPFMDTNEPVSYGQIEHLKTQMVPVLTETYREELKAVDMGSGRNKIVFDVMRKFLTQFFDKEKQNSGFTVLLLEHKIQGIGLEVPVKGSHHRVKLEGTIDRLDRTGDGTLRIIDYKTGKIGSLKFNAGKGKTFEDLLSGQDAVNKKEAFQLFFYRYLLKRMGKYKGQFRLGVYPFKKINDDLEFVEVDKSDIIDEEIVDRFEGVLSGMFRELLDTNIPFSQTEEEKHCHYCPYKNICTRESGQSFVG
ncbi:MAG: hypothetical protein GY940_27715 [bacterium]|nr:hypothetical protein [bacterium]